VSERELAERLVALVLANADDRERLVDVLAESMRDSGDMTPLRRAIALAKYRL
jgi:hypothetical protein